MLHGRREVGIRRRENEHALRETDIRRCPPARVRRLLPLRFIVLAATVLLLAPLAAAVDVSHGEDCGDAAKGCFVYVVAADRDSGAFLYASCGAARWNQDPYSEDTMRACSAATGQGGQGAFVACSQREHRDAKRNFTYLDCFPTATSVSSEEEDGARWLNVTAADLDRDGAPDAALYLTNDFTNQGGDLAARNGTTRGFFDITYRCAAPDPRSEPVCARTVGAGVVTEILERKANASCDFSSIDNAPEEKERCAAGGDLDGDGAPDAAVAKNGTYRPGRPVYGNIVMEAGLAGVSWTGACDGAEKGASAKCSWNGPAGSGAVAHDGLPTTHNNVAVADLDNDGAPDLAVFENGGSVVAFAAPGGCAVFVAAKPGGVPAARTCVA